MRHAGGTSCMQFVNPEPNILPYLGALQEEKEHTCSRRRNQDWLHVLFQHGTVNPVLCCFKEEEEAHRMQAHLTLHGKQPQ